MSEETAAHEWLRQAIVEAMCAVFAGVDLEAVVKEAVKEVLQQLVTAVEERDV